jgi:hypothetical protein
MTRPVRPIALVILTACMLYPGVTLLFQGLYPFVAQDWFNLMGHQGAWFGLADRFGMPFWLVSLLKAGLGGAWLAGVLGLWAGEWKAYPLALLAAAGTLLYPGGATVMAIIGLVCLIFFRENAEEVPA